MVKDTAKEEDASRDLLVDDDAAADSVPVVLSVAVVCGVVGVVGSCLRVGPRKDAESGEKPPKSILSFVWGGVRTEKSGLRE